MTYRYRFTGTQDEELSGLSGALKAAGRSSALVEPGAEVEVPEPVVHPRLEPADPATAAATEELARALEEPEDAPPVGEGPKRRRRRQSGSSGGEETDPQTTPDGDADPADDAGEPGQEG